MAAKGSSRNVGKQAPFKKGSQLGAKSGTEPVQKGKWRQSQAQLNNVKALGANKTGPKKANTVAGPNPAKNWRSPNKAQLDNIKKLAAAKPGQGDNPYSGK